ncbi:hypothetical protein [Phreatobacter stygius]|uniref:Uncharacterized protein n=1 Tax=Phreatobacter stygius TaxID=1940610 RepID=A0A4D7ATD7_9HYPH|nr:hypothetical protein [Phreatobacter stygius]QCI64804.1 hypothetical protein E8M01_11560 [Phreatobacter stygius]
MIVASALLAGCASAPDVPSPVAQGALPPAYATESLVGRWGVASFRRDQDRGRTEAQARSQCRLPYVITKGPTDGVIMHVADDSTPYELKLKGGPGGKTYLGFEAPPGHPQDREIVSFNEPVLIMRFVNPEVAERYGTMVYVRCGR